MQPYKPLEVSIDLKKMTGFLTRIINELGTLYVQCNNIKLEKKQANHIITLDCNGRSYHIELCPSFPFKRPEKIMVDQVDYSRILVTSDARMKPYFQKYTGTNCLCCASIVCPDNWTPATRLANIINEAEFNIHLKYKILFHILCDEVRAKYGLSSEFAAFEEYLF
jgi:hypothetical protein